MLNVWYGEQTGFSMCSGVSIDLPGKETQENSGLCESGYLTGNFYFYGICET